MQAIDSTTGRPAPEAAAHTGPDRPEHLVVVGGAGIFGNTLAQAHAAG